MRNSKFVVCAVATGLVLGSCGTGSESASGGESRNAVITKGWTYPLGTDTMGTGRAFRNVAVAADGTVYAARDFLSEASGLGGVGVDVMVMQFSPEGSLRWSQRIGSQTSGETVDGLTVDDAGNVWVVGTTSGNVAAAPQGQDVWVKSLTQAGAPGVSTQLALKGDQSVAGFDWDSATGTAIVGINGSDVDRSVRSVTSKGEWGMVTQVAGVQINALESDDAGSILVGSTEMETTQLVAGSVTHKTSYITRYSPTGREFWKTKIGIPTPSTTGTINAGAGDDVLSDISISADGSVYAVGNLAPPISTTYEAGFLVRLDEATGTFRWKRLLSALDSLTGAAKGTYVKTVNTTDVGDVWVTGQSKQGFDADFSGTTTSPFAMKFNAAGGQTALRQELSPIYNTAVQDAAVTPDDNLVYALFLGAGGTTLTSLADLPAEPIIDGADSVEQFGSPGPDRAIDIASRQDGGYYAVVSVSSSIGTGPGFGTEDRIIARGPGAQWDTPVGVGLATGRISAIDTTPDGSVVAAGTYTVGSSSTGTPENELWVTKVDREGRRVWYRTIQSLDNQAVTGVSVDSSGNVLVSGTSPTILGTDTVTKSNSFVAVLNPDGSTFKIVQWGGLLGDVTSRAVPVSDREFVVASIEEGADVAGRGLINIKHYSYDGVLIREDRPDNVPVYTQMPHLVQLKNGAFVVMSTTPVVVGAATSVQLRWHRWSPDFSVRMSQTLPKYARMHQDCISDLEALPNGEMLMAGASPCTTSVAQITRNSGFLLRISDLGNVIETRMTGKALYDTYSALDSLPNGSYYVAGTMTSLVLDGSPGSGDVLVRHYAGATAPGSGSTTIVAPVTTLSSSPTTTVPGAAPTTLTPSPTSTVPGAATSTVAPATTVAPTPATTVPAVTTTVGNSPATTVPVADTTATTVAVSPEPTTVMTVPARLDEVADKVGSTPGNFSVSIGTGNVNGTVRESGEIVLVRPASVPASRPFVTSLLPGHRSVTVTWSPVAGAGSYTVTASGGRNQSCSATSTTCTVNGLVPGYPYQFVVTANLASISQSDPSLPVKAVLYVGRNKTVQARKVIPSPTDRTTKVTWKAKGVCKVTPAGLVSAGKKAGKCTVTRSTTKTKKSPATKLTFTVIVR